MCLALSLCGVPPIIAIISLLSALGNGFSYEHIYRLLTFISEWLLYRHIKHQRIPIYLFPYSVLCLNYLQTARIMLFIYISVKFIMVKMTTTTTKKLVNINPQYIVVCALKPRLIVKGLCAMHKKTNSDRDLCFVRFVVFVTSS